MTNNPDSGLNGVPEKADDRLIILQSQLLASRKLLDVAGNSDLIPESTNFDIALDEALGAIAKLRNSVEGLEYYPTKVLNHSVKSEGIGVSASSFLAGSGFASGQRVGKQNLMD
ncbi:hypothetical protein KDL44_11170 [bacterium]|nr:hypothetical protein [bacterium]